jgi:hypothetical protein
MKNKTTLLSFFALSLFGLSLFVQAQNFTPKGVALLQTYDNTSDLPQLSEEPLYIVVREMPKSNTTKNLVLQKNNQQAYNLLATGANNKNAISAKRGGANETK